MFFSRKEGIVVGKVRRLKHLGKKKGTFLLNKKFGTETWACGERRWRMKSKGQPGVRLSAAQTC